MAKIPLDAPEYKIIACREYIQLWQEYFHFFSEELAEKAFSEDDERRFGELINSLSAKHYRFTQLSAPHFKGGPDILKILCETVSLSYLKTLPEAAFNKLQVDWHTSYLNMNKGLGKILALIPPDKMPKVEANIAQLQQQSPAQ